MRPIQPGAVARFAVLLAFTFSAHVASAQELLAWEQTLGGASEEAGRVSRSLGEKIRNGVGTLAERLASMQATTDNDRSADRDDRCEGEGR